jgi:ubiquinone biosynthesis protein
VDYRTAYVARTTKIEWRAMVRTLFRLFISLPRLLRVAFTISRYGLDEYVPNGIIKWLIKPLRLVTGRAQGNRGERLRMALESLGPVFIKLGQLLSTRPDLVPPDLCAELSKLQDRVPPFDAATVKALLTETYGANWAQLFEQFDMKPVAAASIAQVHKAVLGSVTKGAGEISDSYRGRAVAVKMVRPDIAKTIAKDVGLMYTLAALVDLLFSQAERIRPTEIVREFELTIFDELDLIREAANASQLRRNFQDGTLLYVPEVYWDWCHRHVMVLEWIDAIQVTDLTQLKALNVDLDRLGRQGVEIFFTQVFRDAFFHADMHPGNIFVLKDGRYSGVDFGIMGTLNDDDKRYLAENFLAFFTRDYRRVATAHIEAGWVPRDTRVDEFESAIRSVCEPIFGKPLKEIYFGRVLLRLFEVSRRFNMQIQPQLVLLQKTLLQIEGLGRQLNPDLDMVPIAKPILKKWMDEQMGPRALARKLAQDAPFLSQAVPQWPRLMHKALTDNTTERLEHAIERLTSMQRFQTMVLWAMAVMLALLVGGYLLMALDYFRVI